MSSAARANTGKAPDNAGISKETISAAITAFFNAHIRSFDNDAKRDFNKMMGDDRIHEAIAAILKNDNNVGPLLLACVEARIIMRTFNKRVDEERRTPERLNRLKRAVEDLRKFLKEFSRPADPLAAWAVLSDEEITKDQNALDHLELLVEARRQIVAETAPRLGATRKSAITNKRAAELAAIGWVADAVERIAGKPLRHHAAILAEAALGIPDITIDHMRQGLKTRRRKR